MYIPKNGAKLNRPFAFAEIGRTFGKKRVVEINDPHKIKILEEKIKAGARIYATMNGTIIVDYDGEKYIPRQKSSLILKKWGWGLSA